MKPIGYRNYECSNHGRIKNCKILKGRLIDSGSMINRLKNDDGKTLNIFRDA